jgi:hypothetical protein
MELLSRQKHRFRNALARVQAADRKRENQSEIFGSTISLFFQGVRRRSLRRTDDHRKYFSDFGNKPAKPALDVIGLA